MKSSWEKEFDEQFGTDPLERVSPKGSVKDVKAFLKEKLEELEKELKNRKELKRTKFLLGIMIGFLVGLVFWFVIIGEIYYLAPFK